MHLHWDRKMQQVVVDVPFGHKPYRVTCGKDDYLLQAYPGYLF